MNNWVKGTEAMNSCTTLNFTNPGSSYRMSVELFPSQNGR